jgi:hypothetical protein
LRRNALKTVKIPGEKIYERRGGKRCASFSFAMASTLGLYNDM